MCMCVVNWLSSQHYDHQSCSGVEKGGVEEWREGADRREIKATHHLQGAL